MTKFYSFIIILVGLSLLIVGVNSLILGAWVYLPHEYAYLKEHGVDAEANLDKCAIGLGGGHGLACQLTLSTAKVHQTWIAQDTSQFSRLPINSKIPVLFNPQNPNEVETSHDVSVSYEAHSVPRAVAGVIIAGLGLSLIILILARR